MPISSIISLQNTVRQSTHFSVFSIMDHRLTVCLFILFSIYFLRIFFTSYLVVPTEMLIISIGTYFLSCTLSSLLLYTYDFSSFHHPSSLHSRIFTFLIALFGFLSSSSSSAPLSPHLPFLPSSHSGGGKWRGTFFPLQPFLPFRPTSVSLGFCERFPLLPSRLPTCFIKLRHCRISSHPLSGAVFATCCVKRHCGAGHRKRSPRWRREQM